MPHTDSSPPCGVCGRILAAAVLRQRARYCSRACRYSATRQRRAQARTDLLLALEELERLRVRVVAALDVLGLHPDHPRGRRGERATSVR